VRYEVKPLVFEDYRRGHHVGLRRRTAAELNQQRTER
jgi:hypothetical protein